MTVTRTDQCRQNPAKLPFEISVLLLIIVPYIVRLTSIVGPLIFIPLYVAYIHAYVCADTQENPELIWNDEAREKVSGVVKKMTRG